MFTKGPSVPEPIGRLKVRVDGVAKAVFFNISDPGVYPDILTRTPVFKSLFTNFLNLPRESQLEFFGYLEKHSYSSFRTHYFSKIERKFQNIYALAMHGEVNLEIKFTEIDRENHTSAPFFLERGSGQCAHKPYQLIKHVLMDEACFKKLVSNVLFFLGQKKFKPRCHKEFTTSCTNSAKFLTALFFGLEMCHFFESLLIAKFVTESKFYALPSGQKLKYYFSDVFVGKAISEMHKEGLDWKNLNPEKLEAWESGLTNKIDALVEKFSRDLKSHVESMHGGDVSDEKAIAIFKQFVHNYPFHSQVLEDLIEEIRLNALKTTQRDSFCYYVELISASRVPEHVVVIEQCFIEGVVCYRIYQSWIEQATLLEDLNKWEMDTGSGILGTEQMIEFLGKIAGYFVNDEKSRESIKTLFGYSWDPPLPIIFSGGRIASADLIYWCEKIDFESFWLNFMRLKGETAI